MQKMTKRLLGGVAAVCVLLAVAPATANAAGGGYRL